MNETGVRVLIECRKPLVSTPDVFEIYASYQTYQETSTMELDTTTSLTTDALVDPTAAPTTTEPLVDPTDALTTVPTEIPAETNEASTETSTEAPTEPLSSVYNDCQFSKGDSSAFFDSGSPYRNDMRHGL